MDTTFQHTQCQQQDTDNQVHSIMDNNRFMHLRQAHSHLSMVCHHQPDYNLDNRQHNKEPVKEKNNGDSS
jgi:hypothetical protein